MKVLNIEFSVAEMMEVVSCGYPAYSWSELVNKKDLGNFYKTISVVPNNVGPSEKLFFRTYTFGKTAKDDVTGPAHQATHFHIPLFNYPGNVAAEYVTGFPLAAVDAKPTGLVNFGQFNGLQDGAVSTGECNTLKAMQIAGVCHGSPNKDHLYR